MRVPGQTARMGSPHAPTLGTAQTLLSPPGKWACDRMKCSSLCVRHSEQCLTCTEHTNIGCCSYSGGYGLSCCEFFVNEVDTRNRGKRGNHSKIFWKKNYYAIMMDWIGGLREENRVLNGLLHSNPEDGKGRGMVNSLCMGLFLLRRY